MDADKEGIQFKCLKVYFVEAESPLPSSRDDVGL